MGRAIGIDLGTTYSAVAVLDAAGRGTVLNNSEGENTTPSVVFFSESEGKDEPVVGTMAKHMAATSPDDVVQFVKRHMGDPNWRFDSTSGQTYTAEEISAIILKRLKQDAELALGEPVTDAVITVPAYFDDARRTATKQAGKMAGLNVMRVLNEPTAAAISYGLDAEKNGTVLVYDLGGGTFDVTALRIDNLNFEVLGTDGDRNLGGFDFDNALMKLIADDVAKQGGEGLLSDFEATADLREKAEMAKRALSNVAKTNVFITYQGKNYKVSVSRKDFEKATESLLNRTRELVEDVLDETELTWNDIDYLLLIGGSTRMPMVREMMEKLSGKTPESNVNPDEAVALGAAIQAMLEVANGVGNTNTDGTVPMPSHGTDIVIQDVTSQALGVLVLDSQTGQMKNSVMIPRNAKIPGSFSDEFSTVSDNQTEIRVQVTQGDDPDPQFVVILGESTLHIPPYPAGAPIRTTYHYDIDQTVQIEVTDLTSGQSLGSFEIDRSANLNDEQVAAATDKISRMNIE